MNAKIRDAKAKIPYMLVVGDLEKWKRAGVDDAEVVAIRRHAGGGV